MASMLSPEMHCILPYFTSFLVPVTAIVSCLLIKVDKADNRLYITLNPKLSEPLTVFQ